MTQGLTHVSDECLIKCLEAEWARHFGTRRRTSNLKRKRSGYCTSCSIEEMEVVLDDGSTTTLLFKDLSWASLAPEARRIRPEFAYDPAREVLVYRNILAGAGLGTATCYGSVLDPAADRYWLFLEKIDGVELYQVGDISIWQAAAAWLARMHVTMGAQLIRTGDVHFLPRYDKAGYLRWINRATDFLARASDPGARMAGRIQRVASRYAAAVDRLVSLPATIIHGEFYASNVLVEHLPSDRETPADAPARSIAPRVCPVDWERAAIAPGLIDLAALTAGNWTQQDRIAIVSAYRDSWVGCGGMPDGLPTASTLNCCRLFLAVQWLGWADKWVPPSEHAHDWLAEALELAESAEFS